MTDVHYPLAKSQSEAADSKLLPDGTFSAVRNMRLRKDGRLESRYGYATQAGIPAGASSAARTFAFGDQLVSVIDRTALDVPASLINETEPTPGSPVWRVIPQASPGYPGASTLGTLYAGVTRRTVLSAAKVAATSLDSTVDSAGNVWTVVCATIDASTTKAWVTKVAPTGEWLFSATLPTTNPLAVKIVRCGGSVVITHCAAAATATIIQTRIDTTTNVAATSVLVTGVAGCGTLFDVSAGSTTTYWLAYHSAATVLTIAEVTFATGAVTVRATATVTTGHTYYLGLAQHAVTSRVLLLASDVATRVVIGGLWTTAGGVVNAWTSVDASGNAWGYPLVGLHNTGTCYTLNYRVAGRNSVQLFNGSTNMLLAGADSMHAVSRPGATPHGVVVWTADCSSATEGVRTTYYLASTRGLDPFLFASVAFDASSCADVAYRSSETASPDLDIRRNITTTPSGDLTCLLPVFVSSTSASADVVYVTPGQAGEVIQINGQAIMPGAIVREWSGNNLVESGLGTGPKYVALTMPTTGNVEVGTHQYSVVWEWRDEAGRIHRSPPSVPVSVTVVGASATVAVAFSAPIVTSKAATIDGTEMPLQGAAYRTLAGGGIFYFVGSVSMQANLGAFASFTDNLADATIAVNRVLYTQGARGALSGLLPNDPPPPATMAANTATRVLLGGLEDPTAVQWSKLVFPGEPVQWSNDLAYRANVRGEVTGVAVLDGTWIVFTRDTIWEIVGDGPDDTGIGSFAEPRKRPSTTGCISHRSIIEVADGLMFQGTNGGIWLLPRGGNAPQWVGQPVRAITADASAIVAAERVDSENCVYWSCQSSGGLDPLISTYLVVFDTRNGEWYVDPLAYTVDRLTEWNGYLMLDSIIRQTAGAYVDGASTAIVSSATTGDMRSFGPGGWGRMRLVHLLGEFGSACTLTCSISYDSGKTWTDAYSWSLTGTAGDTVDVQFGPSRVRGCDYRLKFSITPSPAGKGLALNAMSLDLYKAERLRRVAAAQRG